MNILKKITSELCASLAKPWRVTSQWRANQRGIADTRGLRRKLPTKVRIKTSRITAIMFVKVRAWMVTGKKIGSVRVEI